MLKNFNEEFDRLIEWDAAKYKNLSRCCTRFTIPGKGAWKMRWPVYASSSVFHFAVLPSTSNSPTDDREQEDTNSVTMSPSSSEHLQYRGSSSAHRGDRFH